ncbi:hypothetical protein [Nocardioides sp. KR10-350]|uniref:hypothetical protein n=1 Tax=Nocardioides cheoyonin TaxID=3156615 RepID=UPI0032B4FAA1
MTTATRTLTSEHADTVTRLEAHVDRLAQTAADLAVYADRADLLGTIIDLRRLDPADTLTGRIAQAERRLDELAAILATASRALWSR